MGSSTRSSHLTATMLTLLLVTCLSLLVVGSSDHHHPKNVKMPAPLGQGTGNDQYEPVDPSYSTPDEVYKAGDKDDCHPVEEIVYENKCLPYVEKTCRTSQKEMCKDVYEKNCTGVTDRVCDTVYDLAQSTKDDFQCVDIDY